MLGRLTAIWGRWEHPRSVAFLRIAIAVVIVGDHLQVGLAGPQPFLFGLAPDGVATSTGVWLEWVLPPGPGKPSSAIAARATTAGLRLAEALGEDLRQAAVMVGRRRPVTARPCRTRQLSRRATTASSCLRAISIIAGSWRSRAASKASMYFASASRSSPASSAQTFSARVST